MAKKNRRCAKCTKNKNFGTCDNKTCSNHEKKIDYPENKRLKKLEAKANRQYRKLKGTIDQIDELHKAFTKQSINYADTLLEIEKEAKTPNFGER